MVSILIRFFFYLRKLKKGYVLDTQDLEIIKAYLAYSFNIFITTPLLCALILLLTAFLLIIFKQVILGYITLGVCIFIIIYFLPLLFPLYRKLYNKSLLKCLELKLDKYTSKNLIYTIYKPRTSYSITKDKVYFFYDDYYFYIMEDLIVTDDKFRYIDAASLNKEVIKFKLSDILSYTVDNKLTFVNTRFKDLLYKKEFTDVYAKIDLKNFKTIIIGYEVGLVLDKIIPDLNEFV